MWIVIVFFNVINRSHYHFLNFSHDFHLKIEMFVVSLIIDCSKMISFFRLIDVEFLRPCEIRNLHAMQTGQCFFMRVANIWSRLLKHKWWDFLYERIYIYSNVFFDFTFNENSLLYDYINRASLEFQPMHVYDQQLWFLFHRCGSFFLFLNNWK